MASKASLSSHQQLTTPLTFASTLESLAYMSVALRTVRTPHALGCDGGGAGGVEGEGGEGLGGGGEGGGGEGGGGEGGGGDGGGDGGGGDGGGEGTGGEGGGAGGCGGVGGFGGHGSTMLDALPMKALLPELPLPPVTVYVSWKVLVPAKKRLTADLF